MLHSPANAGPMTYIVPVLLVGLVILRNSRARRLRIESLWIMPVVILILVGLSLSQQGAPSPLMIGIDLVALVIGAVLGWWRGRFTQITVDEATHELTSRTSPVGMMLLLGIFVLRYALRAFAADSANALHVSVNGVADAALVVSVGLVCAQRLEIALRATRLLTAARAARPAP